MSLSPNLNSGVTLAIFRLSGNIPCWIETLKTWNRIFFKLSYTSIIMLLHQSSKPAAFFRFKLLNASSNSSKFLRLHFFIMRCQKVLKLFFRVRDFFCQFWSNRSKKCVKFFSNVLWILYNGFINFNFLGKKIWFLVVIAIVFSSYFLHNLSSPFRICFNLFEYIFVGFVLKFILKCLSLKKFDV